MGLRWPLVALILLVVALAAAGPRLFSGELHGTEGRRVQIAKEMIASGDWMVPTLNREVTLAKPPLHYWMLASVEQVLGDSLFALRLPAVLCMFLLALLAFLTLRHIRGDAAAWIGALGILCAPVNVEGMPAAEIDPPFAAATAGSLILAAHGAAFGRIWPLVLGGLLGGVALMLKGPPYFLFAAGALLIWARRRQLRGFLWFALPLLVFPALYYIPMIQRLGLEQLLDVAREESIGRAALFEWKHIIDTPAYWLRAVLVLLPLGFWTFYEYRGEAEVREATVPDREVFLRTCAGAALGAILLLTFFPGRPTRYLLPAVPLYLVAVAPAVAAYLAVVAPPSRILAQILVLLGIFGSLCLLVTPFLPQPFPTFAPIFFAVLALAPAVATTRLRVVAFVLAAPVLFSWTLMPTLGARQTEGLRAAAGPAELLREELAARSVDGTTFGSIGHLPSPILLKVLVTPSGDEFGRRPPRTAFVLVEEPDHWSGQRPAFVDQLKDAYVDRVRIRVHRKSLVLYAQR